MKKIEKKKKELTEFCSKQINCDICWVRSQRCGKGVSFNDGMKESEIVECYNVVFPQREAKRIVILADGNTVTAREYEGRVIIREASAKCSPEDKFDFHKGAEIAFKRLNTDKKPSIKEGMLVRVIKNGDPPNEIHHHYPIGIVVRVTDVYEDNRIGCVGCTDKHDSLPQTLSIDQVEPFIQ